MRIERRVDRQAGRRHRSVGIQILRPDLQDPERPGAQVPVRRGRKNIHKHQRIHSVQEIVGEVQPADAVVLHLHLFRGPAGQAGDLLRQAAGNGWPKPVVAQEDVPHARHENPAHTVPHILQIRT